MLLGNCAWPSEKQGQSAVASSKVIAWTLGIRFSLVKTVVVNANAK